MTIQRKRFYVKRGGALSVGLPVAAAGPARDEAPQEVVEQKPGGVLPTEELDDLYVFRHGDIKFFDLGTKPGGSDGYIEPSNTMIFGVGSFADFYSQLLTNLLDDWDGKQSDGMPNRRRLRFDGQFDYIDVRQLRGLDVDKVTMLAEDASRPYISSIFHVPQITTPGSNEGWKQKGDWKHKGDGQAGVLKHFSNADQFQFTAWGFYKDYYVPGAFAGPIKITSEPSFDGAEVDIDDFDFKTIKEVYLVPVPLLMQLAFDNTPGAGGTGTAVNALISRMSPTTGLIFTPVQVAGVNYTPDPGVRSDVDQLCVNIGLYQHGVDVSSPPRVDAHIYLSPLFEGTGTVTPFLQGIIVNKDGANYIWHSTATFRTRYEGYLASHGFNFGLFSGDGT